MYYCSQKESESVYGIKAKAYHLNYHSGCEIECLVIALTEFKEKRSVSGHLHHTNLMMDILSTTLSVNASYELECFHVITQDSFTVAE